VARASTSHATGRGCCIIIDLFPAKLIGDTAYGTAAMLNWLVNEHGIEPHIPVFDKSQHADGTFSRDELAYDPKRDCYICPAGNELRQRQKIYRVPRPLIDRNDMMRYRASKLDCQNCSLKPQCCPNAPPQRSRALSHEGARRLRPRRRFICVSSDTAIRVPGSPSS
jgi:hypothetical protein